MQFATVLAETVFCGSALLTVNGSTPYNGLYGRVPNILPGITQIEEPTGQAAVGTPTLRVAHRLREISTQHMIE